ncbi:hypothetical protein BX600DRAFT_508723 [Xylariales sp. PMI_506]|nr:hypothetical protein BX600DRAFT_508723 [Xylariales sp. PMI_506]
MPRLGDPNQPLKVQPLSYNDGSTWIERFNIAEFDLLSRKAFDRWSKEVRERGSLSSYKFPHNWRPTRVAAVDGDKDLVIISFSGVDFPLSHLNARFTSEFFKPLTKVAIDFKSPLHGRSWYVHPFWCACPGRRHQHYNWCPYQMARFFSHFENLREFYLLFRLAGVDVDRPQGIRKRAAELVDEAMDHFSSAYYTYFAMLTVFNKS